MNKQIYELNAAGRPVRILLRDAETASFFALPMHFCGGEHYDLTVSDELMEQGRPYYPPETSEACLEYQLLGLLLSHRLLCRSGCILHAVAAQWQGRAWLLCAPSGTGKTTQFIRWRRLRGREVRLLSGDQPIVTLEPDGQVQVWASAWTGKERWIDIPGPAPLGGIIFLEQAKDNEIELLTPEASLPRLMGAFMALGDTEEEIRGYAALADAILTGHPAWLLRNRGDDASARLTMQTILNYLSEGSKDA